MNTDKITDRVSEFLSQQKYSEAINYLQNILEQEPENKQAAALLEQIETILRYNNRDYFASTNLDMDPWLE
jgi:uncharacterized Zn finger protein